MKQILIEVLAGDHGVLHSETKPWKDHDNNMVITLKPENIPSDNRLGLLITKEQAMAFFDLVPRYNPEEEMGIKHCPKCGQKMNQDDCDDCTP